MTVASAPTPCARNGQVVRVVSEDYTLEVFGVDAMLEGGAAIGPGDRLGRTSMTATCEGQVHLRVLHGEWPKDPFQIGSHPHFDLASNRDQYTLGPAGIAPRPALNAPRN